MIYIANLSAPSTSNLCFLLPIVAAVVKTLPWHARFTLHHHLQGNICQCNNTEQYGRAAAYQASINYRNYQCHCEYIFHSLPQNVQTGSRAHPASYLMGTGVFSWGWNGQGVNLTTDLQFRLSGATPIHLHSMGRTTLWFTFIIPKGMFWNSMHQTCWWS